MLGAGPLMEPGEHPRIQLLLAPPWVLTAQPSPDHSLGEIGQLERVLDKLCSCSHGFTLSDHRDRQVLGTESPAASATFDAILTRTWVRSEKMTWRAAAIPLGIAPDAFLELAKAHGVPVVRYDDADLRDDLSTLAKLERGRAAGE